MLRGSHEVCRQICHKRNQTIKTRLLSILQRETQAMVRYCGKLLQAGRPRRCGKLPRENTPLHFAAEKGSGISVKILLEFVEDSQRQSLLDAPNKEGQTSLILAAKNGHTECCTQMQGANVDHQDKTGSTALHYACSNGALSCVQHLISNDSDTSIKRCNETTLPYTKQ